MAVWLGTLGGLGLAVPAPGTWGTAAAMPLVWLLAESGNAFVWWGVTAVLIAVGVPICGRAAVDLGQKDPGPVIWDEFATLPIVYAVLPVDGWGVILAGFVLHRVFDITKPWPCRRLERLADGWGVMADDVMAAVYGAAVLAGVRYVGWI